MNVKNLCNQIVQMKGLTFTYGNQIHFIVDVKIDDEKFVIKTNLNEFSRKLESAEEFLKYWVPANATSLSLVDNERQLFTLVQSEKGQADDLISILQDNIKKVQEGAGYIPQAQSVNESVKNIIEIKKLKLDYFKQLRAS